MLAFQSASSWQPASTTATATTKKEQLSNKQIKDYVVILTIILLQYICCKYLINIKLSTSEKLSQSTAKSLPTKTKMGDRLNIGREVRELKLGSTFSPQNSQTAFHTIKYDFKPASVDLNRVATVDVGSNNQVTVTVPNLESSGVPHTVFKGNQRKYTKECLIIFDRKTGVMTLEKLNHNIQVKKTRSEMANKTIIPPPQKLENNTQRTTSKTRVSTGNRKNNIIGFVPRNSPMQQGSPSSYSSTHKSPQTAAPAKCNSRWNASNAQATLPSIPLIEVDDDIGLQMPTLAASSSSSSSMMNTNTMSTSHTDFHQPQIQYHNQNSTQHYNISSSSNNASTAAQSSSSALNLASAAAALEQEIGVLSSSESSSDSDSSGSGSDSDDSADDSPPKQNHVPQQQTYPNGSFPALLHDDLQLSESCSSDSDDD